MSAATTQVTDIAQLREERERRGRISRALRSGKRIASDDMCDGEFFRQVHLGQLLALAQARRLTVNEYQYLLVLIMHSFRPGSYATADMNESAPPSLQDWCAWLGGWKKQQVYDVRTALHEKHIIRFLGDDALRVALNPVWEEWDQSIFQAREARPGGGRKVQRRTFVNVRNENDGADVTPQRTRRPFTNVRPSQEGVTTERTGDAPKAGNDAVPASLTRYLRGEIDSDMDTAAIAAGPAPMAPAPPQDADARLPSPSRRRDKKQGESDAQREYGPPPNWPDPAPGETDFAFFKRAVQMCANKTAAVAYVAHLKLRVPNNQATINRIIGVQSALKKRFGVENTSSWRIGLVMVGVLEAANGEPDSDLFDYITKCAIGHAEREREKRDGHYGKAGRTTRREAGERFAANAGKSGPTAGAFSWRDD